MTILGGHNCVPGERLGSIDEFEGGRGTYIRKGFIYSSRIGKIRFLPVILKVWTYLFIPATLITKQKRKHLSKLSEKMNHLCYGFKISFLSTINRHPHMDIKGNFWNHNESWKPSIGATVTCKVIQVTQKQARCTIHAFNGKSTS